MISFKFKVLTIVIFSASLLFFAYKYFTHSPGDWGRAMGVAVSGLVVMVAIKTK